MFYFGIKSLFQFAVEPCVTGKASVVKKETKFANAYNERY